ncbi:hypothetical protein RF11_02550 [Thelohanellus kitauei]|uniref:Uncharacterized protein n=1 Tax=Thelohanellus kitauei TaxID=669202 RepID=A0A0C2J4Z3_THEKT|nr:hypothetical protein RF11_02550 [Thelohanellus kitauei]
MLQEEHQYFEEKIKNRPYQYPQYNKYTEIKQLSSLYENEDINVKSQVKNSQAQSLQNKKQHSQLVGVENYWKMHRNNFLVSKKKITRKEQERDALVEINKQVDELSATYSKRLQELDAEIKKSEEKLKDPQIC